LNRSPLDLDAWELVKMGDSLRECIAFALIGFASAAMASRGDRGVAVAGMMYPLLAAPLQILNGMYAGQQWRRLGPRPTAIEQ